MSVETCCSLQINILFLKKINLNIKHFKVQKTEFSGITKHYYASPCLKTKTGRFKKSNKSFESNDFIERKGEIGLQFLTKKLHVPGSFITIQISKVL